MKHNTHRSRLGKRFWLLVTVAVVTLLGVLFLREYHFARPVGEGPAGPDVDATAFKSGWTDRSVHVLGIGDSVTAGLGAQSTSHRYFNRVLRNPPDEFLELRGVCLEAVIPKLTSENLAISGSESDLHASIIREDLPVYGEEIFGLVMMTSGGNDLIHSYGRSKPRECAMYGATLMEATPWIENYRLRLDRMFSRLDECFPGGCEVYIADIYDPTDGQGDAPSIYLPDWPDGLAIHAKYNGMIRGVAGSRSNVFVVPLYQTFLGHGAHCRQWWLSTYRGEDPFYWFHSNVEDPNDRGYDAIRRVFLNTIVEHTTLRDRSVE